MGLHSVGWSRTISSILIARAAISFVKENVSSNLREPKRLDTILLRQGVLQLDAKPELQAQILGGTTKPPARCARDSLQRIPNVYLQWGDHQRTCCAKVVTATGPVSAPSQAAPSRWLQLLL